jgi:hypothetical protein
LLCACRPHSDEKFLEEKIDEVTEGIDPRSSSDNDDLSRLS